MTSLLSNECTIKKPTSLDLSNGRRTARRPHPSQLLESPDLKRIGLTSPELEKFIIQMASPLPKLNNILPFSGLTPCDTPSQEVVKCQLKDDQQASCDSNKLRIHLELTKDTVTQLTSNDHQPAKLGSSLGNANSYNVSVITSNDTNSAINTQVKAITPSSPIIKVKSESKSSNCSTPAVAISSVNSSSSGRSSKESSRREARDDESSKLEKKRERNRQAAAKCRFKKIQRIQELEGLKNQLTKEREELTEKIKAEENQIARLREYLMDHIKTDCKKKINISTLF